MKSQISQHRPYQEVGALIRDLIVKTPYRPGDRLPPEREIAEMLDVTRTVVREALIMLEIIPTSLTLPATIPEKARRRART